MVAACDDTFEPIKPSDLAFSVFGYLDAGVDTQWVRVMPVRDLKVTTQEPLDATVTVEELGTGRIIALRDSLFDFSPPFDWHLGSEGIYLHNFWTTERIEAGATYRFTAIREGTEPSEAIVQTPPDYDVEVWINQQRYAWEDADSLRITGLKHLAFLRMLLTFHANCPPWPDTGTLRVPVEAHAAEDGVWVAAIRKSGMSPQAPGCAAPVVDKWDLWMMGSEAPWPSGGMDPSVLGDSIFSNISHAVGFLGGVFTKLIPYEDCKYRSDGAPVPHFCRLRYDRETATLIGSLSAVVGGTYKNPAEVRLTELNQDPARIRTVRGRLPGEFVIGALRPGIPHVLEAYPPQLVVDDTLYVSIYRPYTDTLTFLPGERLEYEIRFERLPPGVPRDRQPDLRVHPLPTAGDPSRRLHTSEELAGAADQGGQ